MKLIYRCKDTKEVVDLWGAYVNEYGHIVNMYEDEDEDGCLHEYIDRDTKMYEAVVVDAKGNDVWVVGSEKGATKCQPK